MPEPHAVIIALSLALLIPQGMPAQVASKLEAGAMVTSKAGEVPASTLSVSPGIRVDFPLAAISASGSAWLTGQQWQIADGTVSGSVVTPTRFHLRGEFIADASRAFDDRSIGNDQVDGQARVNLVINQHGGFWLGGGAARPWRVAVVSYVDVTGGGAWTRLGDATLSGTYTNFFFTKVAQTRDSTAPAASCAAHAETLPGPGLSARASFSADALPTDCRRYSRFSDLEGGFHLEHGIIELTAQSGYRFGDSYDVTADSRRWASLSTTLWVTSQIAAVAGGGRVPANPSRGLPARNYANFGVMLAYAPFSKSAVPVTLPAAMVRSFDLSSSSPGTEKITVRLGGVESIDVMGDFSDWNPLALVRRGRDLWELTLPMSTGVHQINIRIDGGPWLTPPGMPTMKDGYSGDVGLLVVP